MTCEMQVDDHRRERQVPRLDTSGPVIAGALIVLAFFGLGVGAAALAPIDKGIGMPGTIIVESRVKPVQHEQGGTVAIVHVSEGQHVGTGDLIATMDVTGLSEQLTALTKQSEAADRQLQLARQETGTMRDLYQRQLASRSRLLTLERQVAEIEKEVAALGARIEIVRRDLSRSEIRAPEAGRILSLAVKGAGGVIQAGATVAELVPDGDRLVIEGRLNPNQIEDVRPGMPAKVWLKALSWREQRPLSAKLAWISPDSIEDRRTGATYFSARVELDDNRTALAEKTTLQPGMRSDVLLMTGERTLLDQLLDPLMRNINKAFQG